MNSGCKQGRAINFKAGEDRALEINYPDYNVHCPAIGTKGLNAYHEACVQRSKQTVQPFCCSKCHIGVNLKQKPIKRAISKPTGRHICDCGEPRGPGKKYCVSCKIKHASESAKKIAARKRQKKLEARIERDRLELRAFLDACETA